MKSENFSGVLIVDAAVLATIRETIRQLGLPGKLADTPVVMRALPKAGDFLDQVKICILVENLPTLIERNRRQFIKRHGLSPANAADVSQDLAVKVLTAIANYRIQRNIGAWFARVVWSSLHDFQRRQETRRAALKRLAVAYCRLRRG